MRLGREAWVLAVLLLIFIGFTAFYTQRGFEQERRSRPSSYSTGRNGLAAALRLIEREGLRVGRLETPYTRLPENAGLLVAATPFARPLTPDEKADLEEWLDGGGSLLLLITSGPTGVSSELPIEDVQVREWESGPADIGTAARASPYLRDVGRVHVTGNLRLIAAGNVVRPQTLVGDEHGAYALTWTKGAGRIVAATGGIGISNSDLGSADNAVLLANIAGAHARGARPLALFDEYHQGYGEEGGGRSLWQAIGAPTRAVVWYSLVVFLAVIYNANRRLGTPKRLPIPTSRPSTEYISSMAGLYRRAGAADVAIELTYRAFARDLCDLLDAPPDAGAHQIANLAEKRLGWRAGALADLLGRCEAITHGARATPAEMVKLARQMHDYRRRADLA